MLKAKSRRKNKNFFVFVISIILAVVFWFYIKSPVNTKNKEVQPIPVKVGFVEEKEIDDSLQLIGNVIPYQSVLLKARLDSQIIETHIKDGDEVDENQLLFSLDDRIIQSNLKQNQADMNSAKATLEKAEKQYKREEELIKKGTTSQTVFDQSYSDYLTAKANLESKEAQRENLLTQLDFTKIKSPIKGKIGTLSFTKGNMVYANGSTTLATINQVDVLRVNFNITQQYFEKAIALLQKKSDPSVRILLPSKQPIMGTLMYEENKIDEQTRTLQLTACINNTNKNLWPGMFVDVELILTPHEKVLAVPSSAVQKSSQGDYIFVVDNKKTVKQVFVKVKKVTQDLAILEDPKPQTLIVIDGLDKLQDGTQISFDPPLKKD